MPDSLDKADNAGLQSAIQAIIRRELILSEDRMAQQRLQLEERLTTRVNAAVDDLRSEVRALRATDEALASRLAAVTQKVDSMTDFNQEMIGQGVRQALSQIFSPLRIIGAMAAVLGLLTLVMTFAIQISNFV